MNGELNTMTGKLCTESHLKWFDALLFALFYLQSMPKGNLYILPFEMLFDLPLTHAKPFNPVYMALLGGDTTIATYIRDLQIKIKELQGSGPLVQVGPIDFSLHSLLFIYSYILEIQFI